MARRWLCLIAAAVALLVPPAVDGKVVPLGANIYEKGFVRKDWVFTRKFLYKRDADKNGVGKVPLENTRAVTFPSGEMGSWKIKLDEKGVKPAKLVIEVGNMYEGKGKDRRELLVTYEIEISEGKFHPAAIRFLGEGQIFVEDMQTKELAEVTAKFSEKKDQIQRKRKKIGTFRPALEGQKPLLDRTYR